MKLGSDAFCIIGILFALYSICKFHYCSSVVAYYAVIISFILGTAFCVYILTCLVDLDFSGVLAFLKYLLLYSGLSLIMFCLYSIGYCFAIWLILIESNKRKHKKTKIILAFLKY